MVKFWKFTVFLTLGPVLFFCRPTCAAPAEIIFLRHAEKPETGAELNARGWQRAGALPALFEKDPRVLTHGLPVAIFSGAPAKQGGSVRSIQTMQATAKTLHISINQSITRDQIADLVRTLLAPGAYDGKTVLVCWEHKKIPEMLKAFGWKEGPERWADEVFDRLWILEFEDGKPVRFHDWPQRLLPGDSER